MNKVSKERIEEVLNSAKLTVKTIADKCTLVTCELKNGFILTQSSGAISKENYSEDIGKTECVKKIKDELWKLEGYHLANLIAEKKLENLSFGEAVERLKDGEWISRKGWNGKGMYLSLQKPTEKSKMTRPYIYMKTADDMLVPWVASQGDILCDDWYVFSISNIKIDSNCITASIETGNEILRSKIDTIGIVQTLEDNIEKALEKNIIQTLENKTMPYTPVGKDLRKW